MKTKIKPTSLYWASFNRFELRLSGEAVLSCSHQGDCEDDCRRYAPIVRAQIEKDDFPNKPTPDKIRAELKEYGTWDYKELMDDEMNWIRLIWIAAWNIHDEESPDCSRPLSKSRK